MMLINSHLKVSKPVKSSALMWHTSSYRILPCYPILALWKLQNSSGSSLKLLIFVLPASTSAWELPPAEVTVRQEGQQIQPPFRDLLALNFHASPHFPTGFNNKEPRALNLNSSYQLLNSYSGLSCGTWDAEEEQSVDTTNPLRTFLSSLVCFLAVQHYFYPGG